MPKIISNLHDSITQKAKEILLEKGYAGLTIKEVATACGIANGTMYNYFTSKQYLVGCIILKDWEKAHDAMRQNALLAQDLDGCFSAIYVQMSAFVQLYKVLFFSKEQNSDAGYNYFERHEILVSQISEVIAEYCAAKSASLDKFTQNFIAESIITYSLKQCDYAPLSAIYKKIVD